MERIRDAKFQDAERILEIYEYYVENTAITFEYETPALSEFQSRMHHIMKRYPYLVLEKDGKIQGYAYASAFIGRAAYDWSCGNPEPVCLHRISGSRRCLSDKEQRGISFPSGFFIGRQFSQMRLQIRPLVQYDLDGKKDRNTSGKTAACKVYGLERAITAAYSEYAQTTPASLTDGIPRRRSSEKGFPLPLFSQLQSRGYAADGNLTMEIVRAEAVRFHKRHNGNPVFWESHRDIPSWGLRNILICNAGQYR